MAPFRSRTLAACVPCLLLAAGALAQEPLRFKEKLPPETLIYAAFPDIQQSAKDFEGMPLMKLWREEEVQEFVAKPLAMLPALFAQGTKFLASALEEAGVPLKVEEILALRPGGLFYAVIGPGGPGEPIRFAGAIQVGGEVAPLERLVGMGLGMLQAQKEQMGEALAGVKSLELAGAKAVVADTTTQGGPFSSFTLAYRGGLFLMASSEALARQILGPDPETSLAKDKTFRHCFSKLRALGAEAELFIRPAGILQALEAALPALPVPELAQFLEEFGPKIQAGLAASGLKGLEAIALSSTYIDGKAAWDSFTLAPAPRKGLLALGDGAALDLGHLAWVPKDAAGLSMGILPMNGLLDTLLGIATAVDEQAGQMAAVQLGLLKEQIGVDIKADLLDLLGGEFIYFSGNMNNITSAPPMTLLLQVKDQEKFLNSLETLLGLTQGAVTLSATKDPGTGQALWRVELDASLFGDAVMGFNPAALLQPTFAFQEGFWVLGLTPRDVRRTLAQMQGKAKGDIRENPAVAALLKELPEKVTGLSYSDTRGTIETFYTMGQGLLGLVPLPRELPLDLALLPGGDTVGKHFFPGTSYQVTLADGFLSRGTSSFGPEVLLGAGAVGAAAALWIIRAEEAGMLPGMELGGRRRPARPSRTAPAPPVQVAPAPEGVTEGQQKRIRDDLDTLSGGLLIYMVENGSFPAALDVLIEPTKNYPRGFLSNWATSLPKDPWGRLYLYQKTANGYRVWSVGPNGADENGGGDDILRER